MPTYIDTSQKGLWQSSWGWYGEHIGQGKQITQQLRAGISLPNLSQLTNTTRQEC